MSRWATSRGTHSTVRAYSTTPQADAATVHALRCRRIARIGSASPAASIRFATRADALCIAEMPRDFIEHGLGWSWTRERILRSLRHRDTNAIVAVREADRAGFGIMKYGDEEAHLLLLAVKPSHRRCGVASEMLMWLQRSGERARVGRNTPA